MGPREGSRGHGRVAARTWRGWIAAVAMRRYVRQTSAKKGRGYLLLQGLPQTLDSSSFSHASERRWYATPELLTLPKRKEPCVLGRRDPQDLAWPLIVAGNTGADTQVRSSFDE